MTPSRLCYECYAGLMGTIAHRDLRNDSASILRRVAAGESFDVTNNGVLAARLVPPGESSLARLKAAGHARPARVGALPFAGLRRTDELSSREVLDDLRGDR